MKTPRKYKTLGLLDLYGFESLVSEDPGGFEQLVFNFAAEKVQRVILEWTMVLEQQEYVLEGVEWTHLDFIDNGQVVTLLERGSFGVFSILEDVCMSSNNIVMSQPPPPASTTTSTTASNRDDEESGTSTPSLMTVSPDDIFLERLAERFGSHPCVEVKPNTSNGGYSSNTTAPVSSEDTSTPEVGATSTQTQPSSSKECETPSKLPHHCFRYYYFYLLIYHLP